MSDPDFPSGPWKGFFNYTGLQERHRMQLTLTFANGDLTGEGNDSIGPFVIRGRYDAKLRECHWTKTYVGGHDVFYRGFREGKGIWGIWEIGSDLTGGFHIWPVTSGSGDAMSESGEDEEVFEMVGTAPNGESRPTFS